MSTFTNLIHRAIAHHGSQKKLADSMGCSQQQIAYLLKAKNISAEMAKKIDEATGGAVSRHDLRPDIFGAAPAKGRAA